MAPSVAAAPTTTAAIGDPAGGAQPMPATARAEPLSLAFWPDGADATEATGWVSVLDGPGAIPPCPGAYVLLVGLDRPVVLPASLARLAARRVRTGHPDPKAGPGDSLGITGRGATPEVGRDEPPCLWPGYYVYCGSARGSGGLRPRLGRHLAATKPLRWHVDHLTCAVHAPPPSPCACASGVVPGLWALPLVGAAECALVAALLAAGGEGGAGGADTGGWRVTVPVPGFGASDCRRCPAHLLALHPPGTGAAGEAGAVGEAGTAGRVVGPAAVQGDIVRRLTMAGVIGRRPGAPPV